LLRHKQPYFDTVNLSGGFVGNFNKGKYNGASTDTPTTVAKAVGNVAPKRDIIPPRSHLEQNPDREVFLK